MAPFIRVLLCRSQLAYGCRSDGGCGGVEGDQDGSVQLQEL